MDRSRSFGAAVGTYEQGRPDYPEQAVAWLLEPLPQGVRRVADVGAGSGKLARVLVGLGCRVQAVDPDERMLDTLRERVPGIEGVQVGTAEGLPLADHSVQAVVLGQAWHWVDPEAGCREIARVLAPGGLLGLIWNVRDVSDPFVQAMNTAMPVSVAEQMVADGPPPIAEPFSGLEHADWSWTRPMNRDAIHKMARSRSHYLTSSEDERRALDENLDRVLDEHGVGEEPVGVPYRTHAFRCVLPG